MTISGEGIVAPKPRLLDKLLERPGFYTFTQKLNPFTASRIRALARRYIPNSSEINLLDLGCGVGAYYPLLARTTYFGIDINPRYIDIAAKRYGAKFRVMDAGRLEFPDGSFDSAVSIAMTHHLDDASLRSMVCESMRVLRHLDGRVHIIDAILPLSRGNFFKRLIFMSDRGRNQRRLTDLSRLFGGVARIACVDVMPGPVHDVAYFQLARPGA